MKLVKMIINNYRQFEKAVLDFDDNVTIIAGANNSGKTSLITLIKNMILTERIVYSESDIPAKNMRVWMLFWGISIRRNAIMAQTLVKAVCCILPDF